LIINKRHKTPYKYIIIEKQLYNKTLNVLKITEKKYIYIPYNAQYVIFDTDKIYKMKNEYF